MKNHEQIQAVPTCPRAESENLTRDYNNKSGQREAVIRLVASNLPEITEEEEDAVDIVD